MDVVSDHELVMHCKVVCLDMPFYYSNASNVIIFSKAQWEKEGENGVRDPPRRDRALIFKERQLGRYVLYERGPVPHWKRGTVDWKELQMTWTLEEPTRFAQLLAGETHLTEVNKDLADDLVKKGYKLIRSRARRSKSRSISAACTLGRKIKPPDATRGRGITGKLDPEAALVDQGCARP